MKSGRKWKSSARGKTGLGLGPRHRERTGWMGRPRCKACVNKHVKEQWRANVPGTSACCLDSYLENNQFSCITQSFSFSLKLYQNIVDLEYCVNFSDSVIHVFFHMLFQFSSVAQSCPTLRDPMNHSTPGLPVYHQLPEFIQTHVHWVGGAIQPPHPLSSPSPPALNLSQHQGLFKWVSSLHQVAKVLEFQLQHRSFQWTPRTDLL